MKYLRSCSIKAYSDKSQTIVLMKKKLFEKWTVYKYVINNELEYLGKCLFAKNAKKFIK